VRSIATRELSGAAAQRRILGRSPIIGAVEPSAYERGALDRIQVWKQKRQTLGPVRRVMALALDKAERLLFKVPGVTWAVDESVGKLARALNELAQSSVRRGAIHKDFRGEGDAPIREPEDVRSLDLEQIDKAIGRLAAKYKALALAEGAATGFVGFGGLPVDLVALVLLNLRAIGEYATYCGFDIRSQQERIFAMNVLGFVSGPTPGDKHRALAQLAAIARDVSTKRPWKDLKKHTLIRVIKRIARSLGIRLTKAKLAQIIPAAGAVVGGVFNAQFTSSVCDAAFMLYRERFLAEKYGVEPLAVTGP
jgi:hypothetical protein